MLTLIIIEVNGQLLESVGCMYSSTKAAATQLVEIGPTTDHFPKIRVRPPDENQG